MSRHDVVMLVGLTAWSVLLALALVQLAAELRYRRWLRRVHAVPQAAPQPRAHARARETPEGTL